MKYPALGQSFTLLDTVDSTNLYAMQQIRAGLAQHGSSFFAMHQTQGRGQRGKQWWSKPGENIQLSVVFDCSSLSLTQKFSLSAMLALAVQQWLEHKIKGWKIKWPNDLYYGDRKTGGLLVENVVDAGRWKWAVAGIGLNINSLQFDEHLPNPVSLSQLTGLQYNVVEESKNLLAEIENYWKQLKAHKWSGILAAYNANLYGRGDLHRLKYKNSSALHYIHSVDAGGHLRTGQMGEFQFDHGEVTWEINPPR